MRNHVRQSMRLLMLAAIAPLVGCASLYDCEYEISQRWRSRCAYTKFKHTCDSKLSADYGCGWQAGYYDVITGGTGCPPIFAPKRFWKPCMVVGQCDQNRHQWYVGFQDGAACASQQPDSHYLKMWMPPCTTCQTSCPTPSCRTISCPPSVDVAPVEDIIIDEPTQIWDEPNMPTEPAVEAPTGAESEAAPSNGPVPPSDPMPKTNAAPEADTAAADRWNLSFEHNTVDDPEQNEFLIEALDPQTQSAELPQEEVKDNTEAFEILGPLDVALVEPPIEPFTIKLTRELNRLEATMAASRQRSDRIQLMSTQEADANVIHADGADTKTRLPHILLRSEP